MSTTFLSRRDRTLNDSLAQVVGRRGSGAEAACCAVAAEGGFK